MAPKKTYESLAQAAERTEVSIKTLRRRIAAGQQPRLPLRTTHHPPRSQRGRQAHACHPERPDGLKGWTVSRDRTRASSAEGRKKAPTHTRRGLLL